MKKLRVLGIAPYNNLALIMQQAAKKRTDIELTVYTGDLEDGARIASQYTGSDYDFIISRGGTAQMIRDIVNIPVAEIEVSPLDLLRCIQIAQNASKHYALIGFPNITKNSEFLKSLLSYHMDIFTIHSQSEAEVLLKNFAPNQYDIILSDSIINSLAKVYHFHTILITSGQEAVDAVLNQIVFYGTLYQKTYWQNNLYRSLLNTHPFDIYVFSSECELIYHSREDVYSNELVQVMKNMVPAVLVEGKKKLYRKYSGLLASISGTRKNISQQDIAQFYVNFRKMPLSLFKNGLQYKNREEVLNNADNLYLNFVSSSLFEQLTRKLYLTKAPIFILSEHGMARDDFAEAFYAQSEECNNPLTSIDCARLVNDKNWDYLMQDMNSPLSDTETTIYIKNVDILPEQKFREFLASISDTKLHLRNRIIFEMMHAPNTPYPERCIIIQNRFNCISVEIPPLRKMKEQISQLASLFINAFNVEFGKEIVGLKPASLNRLLDFDWPYNYTQFRRVISKLGAMSEIPFIEPETVEQVLHSEELVYPALAPDSSSRSPQTISLSLDKDLDTLTKDIIEAVLHEEDGNQSAAARRLGISRTTLWRILR